MVEQVSSLTPYAGQSTTSLGIEEDPIDRLREIPEFAEIFDDLEKENPSTRPPLITHADTEHYLEPINMLREAHGEEPIRSESSIRRLQALLNRLAEIVEKHMAYKKDESFSDEQDMKKNTVPTIAGYTRGQAGASALAALSIPVSMITAALLPAQMDTLRQLFITGIPQFASSASGAITQHIGSWQEELRFKEQMHMNTAQSKKQGEEGIKRLPEAIEQLLQKVADTDANMTRKAFEAH